MGAYSLRAGLTQFGLMRFGASRVFLQVSVIVVVVIHLSVAIPADFVEELQ